MSFFFFQGRRVLCRIPNPWPVWSPARSRVWSPVWFPRVVSRVASRIASRIVSRVLSRLVSHVVSRLVSYVFELAIVLSVVLVFLYRVFVCLSYLLWYTVNRCLGSSAAKGAMSSSFPRVAISCRRQAPPANSMSTQPRLPKEEEEEEVQR